MLNKLIQVSNFFESKFEEDIFCKSCKIAHTGRNAYAIGIWLYLYEFTDDKKYFDLSYL